MKLSSRPSLWRRLTARRRTASGPDFGDMGTAFGLDAITPVITEWAGANLDEHKHHDDTMHAAHLHALMTSEPS